MKPILLFDIDGTLLRVRKEFMYKMISELLNHSEEKIEKLSEISFAGRTDKEIFTQLAVLLSGEKCSALDDTFIEIKKEYLNYMSENFNTEHVQLLDGVGAVLKNVVEDEYQIGLCTGNFKEAAYMKIDASGIQQEFLFGGFGCRHADRNYLPKEAHHDFKARYNFEPIPEQYAVIGDTPHDIRCAKHFGAISVAVATGNFTVDDLKLHQPDVIAENLEEAIHLLENR